MKITVLIENLAYREDLIAEHGLSVHIDTGNKKILFDTGQTSAFADNANKLGINLSDVDYLVISHGHYDHTGGLNKFLAVNPKAEIFISQRALNKKYKDSTYIGVPPDIDFPADRTSFVEKPISLTKNLYILGDIKPSKITDTHFNGFYEQHHSEIIPDVFKDELVICLVTDEGIHIVSGCSHNGITNIHLTAKNYFAKPVISLIGGFHLVHSSIDQIKELAEYFDSVNLKSIYTGHCTGVNNYYLLKEYSKALVEYIHTGSVIDL